jgi:signal transduction histidine kinase
LSLPAAVALASAGLNGTIGALAYLRGRKQSLYRSYAILGFSFALWGIAYAAVWPQFDDPLWMKVLYTPLALLPAAALSFVWCFTGLPEKQRRLRTVPLYGAGYLLIGMLWTRAVSPDFFRFSFIAFLFPPCALCVGLLYKHWRSAGEAAERNRRGYMFFAALIAVVGGFTDFLTPFGVPPLANLSLMAYSVIVLMAIGRHHLLDLSAAAGRVAVVGALAVALGLVLSGLSWLVRAVDGSLFFAFFLLSLLVLLAAPPVSAFLALSLGRRFSARQDVDERALAALARELEAAVEPAAIAAAVKEGLRAAWGAEAHLEWGGLRGLDAVPALSAELRRLLSARPAPATLEEFSKDEGAEPGLLAAALKERRAEAVVPVVREGELAAALFLGPPRRGFYDLSALRWLSQLSLLIGRSIHAAELAAGLLRADRLAQLGTLSAGIAHELRNPLSSMLGAVELLQQGLPRERQEEYLSILKEEVLRLDGAVRELLDYASAKPAKARCEWTEVFGRVERLAAQPGLRLDKEGEPAELAVSGAHLQQILLNLVRNAARAAESSKEPRVTVAVRSEDGRAFLTVDDNGAGIPEEVRPKLFAPFESYASGGTGLGLATVKRLAELYGGRAWAENLPRGARFGVELPLARTAEP